MVKFNFIVLKKVVVSVTKCYFSVFFLSFSSVFGFSSTFFKLNIGKGNDRVLLGLVNSLVLYSDSNGSDIMLFTIHVNIHDK